jgi:hypothetical protein
MEEMGWFPGVKPPQSGYAELPELPASGAITGTAVAADEGKSLPQTAKEEYPWRS